MPKKTTKKKKKPTATNRDSKGAVTVAKKTELEEIKKKKEFDMFSVWYAMPSVFLGKSTAYLKEIGVTDEDALTLLSIPHMKAFATKYKLSQTTLTDWKRKIVKHGLADDTKDFFKGLTKNVMASFYHQTVKNADAHRVRLWMEIFEGKEPEGSMPPMPQLLGPNFNTVIINLKEQYDSDLKKAYEETIRQNAKEVSSTERVHPDPPNEGGTKKG